MACSRFVRPESKLTEASAAGQGQWGGAHTWVCGQAANVSNAVVRQGPSWAGKRGMHKAAWRWQRAWHAACVKGSQAVRRRTRQGGACSLAGGVDLGGRRADSARHRHRHCQLLHARCHLRLAGGGEGGGGRRGGTNSGSRHRLAAASHQLGSAGVGSGSCEGPQGDGGGVAFSRVGSIPCRRCSTQTGWPRPAAAAAGRWHSAKRACAETRPRPTHACAGSPVKVVLDSVQVTLTAVTPGTSSS